MVRDIPPAPPEARVIRLAREATGMTARSAAEATRARDPAGKGISPAYWRNVEQGYGYRRGERVPVTASARLLAAMARVVGVTPAQLTAAGRDDAARVLEEARRRDSPAAVPLQRHRPGGIAAPSPPGEGAESMVYEPVIRRRLADLAKAGDPRPSGEAIFDPDSDPLGMGENTAAGVADGWDEGMRRGLDLDTAVRFAARAWALMAAYEARTKNGRASGRSGALTPT